ncbi:MAG: penicillin-binding protein 2 [Bacteroidales bacterium]|nr:penicillin-binding protein 2 [Bacteroidales bacterium]
MKDPYQNRRLVIGGIILFTGILYLIRLLILQVLDTSYKLSAESNSRQREIEYPGRGLILDRNGKVLASNEPVYDLMMIPRKTESFDTLALCSMLGIQRAELDKGIQSALQYSRYKPYPVVRQIDARRFAILEEQLFKYKGFYVQTRTRRIYPEGIASHVIGYMGEIDLNEIRQDPYYAVGDYLGQSGLELQYEKELRGRKGIRYQLVDVFNQVKGSYEGGRYDTLPEPGKNLLTTLNSELQKYGELLMTHKSGSIVAIEPATGEILCMVSSPSFDLNKLTGRERTRQFEALSADTLEPLFNRATMSRYAPGSIFKIVQALIGLDLGVIRPQTGFKCDKSLIGCHNHPEATNLKKAIQYSCNPYFYQVYRRIILRRQSSNIFTDSELGLADWQKKVMSFGLGQLLQIDLPGVSPGFIPGPEFYDTWYGRHRWAFSTIYSNCNGQGEVETVPVQIANLAAIIANRGYYYVPHFIRSIGEKGELPEVYRMPHHPDVNAAYYPVVINAMRAVIYEPSGTGRRAQVPGVIVCGKTGTVQNNQGEDHSGFFAFAPMQHPAIAISVYVEHAGSGGFWAAMIASLMMEKYLNGEVTQAEKEKMVLEYKQF